MRKSHRRPKILSSLRTSVGFTLIEVLVVTAIISLLSSIILASIRTARAKAQTARAMADLYEFRNAIQLMSDDVEVWPNGCMRDNIIVVPEPGAMNEVELDDSHAGLLVRPPVGATAPPTCIWTATEVAAWNGPYMGAIPKDPSGRSYWFDSDYEARRDCPTPNANPSNPTLAVIVSGGPNGVSGAETTNYDCDDIYLSM